MPTPIDPKKLPGLRATLKRFKPGEMLPQKELATIYGVTNARFTTLIHERFENFPPPERHNDKTHWYEARPAIESMIAYLSGQGAKKRASAVRAAEVMGAVKRETAGRTKKDPEPDEEPLMTPAEIDKLASGQTRVFRLAQEKREFVRAALVTHIVRLLFTTVQRSVSSIPAAVDPNGELPPLHRARLESAVRDMMVLIHGTVKDVLADDDVVAGVS
ncbi:MAG: hypothetical protein V4696_03635 [Pseudomonadota bacterium]